MKYQIVLIVLVGICCARSVAPQSTDEDPCAQIQCDFGAECQVGPNNSAICACSEVCPLIYEPVCGSDGQTYGNTCSLSVHACKQKQEISVAHMGACENSGAVNERSISSEPAKRVNPCSLTLCETNSFCQVNSEGQAECIKTGGIKPQRQAEPENDPCALVRCGYGAQCQVNSDGRATCQCPDVCLALYQPVCGTDGRTYANQCQLDVNACKQQRSITKAHDGECVVAEGDDDC